MDDRDYITRTIATVRNHRDADNCWPQWANLFADEIERLREALAVYASPSSWLTLGEGRGVTFVGPGKLDGHPADTAREALKPR